MAKTKSSKDILMGVIQCVDLVIPEGVTEIKAFAYKNGVDLRSVTIPASVTQIGDYAFEGCKYILEFHISPDNMFFSGDFYGALYDKNKTVLIRVPTSFDDEFETPNGVLRIESGAFQNSIFTKVTIPESVAEIGNLAFAECGSLQEVRIPWSVTKIGRAAFKECPNLTIYAPAGSYGETYAKDNHIPLVVI